jgi:hypothetical protein
MKKYFRIKIEIYIFTKQGREMIIEKKTIQNSTNGFIGFLKKHFNEI